MKYRRSMAYPLWLENLLLKLLREDYSDEIIGDMAETFYWRSEHMSVRKARNLYILEAIKSMKPSNLKPFYHYSLNTMIFRNHIKIAIKSLFKRKSISLLNLLGLTFGTLAFMIISLYSAQILSFDNFFEGKDRVFLAYKERITPDGTQAAYDTWLPMSARLRTEYTQVQAATSHFVGSASVIQGSQYIAEEINYTENEFFDIFSFPLDQRIAAHPLPKQNAIVLSQEMAEKYFPDQSPMGEELRLYMAGNDTTIVYEVSGVLAAYPENISIRPQFIAQISSLPFYTEQANEWDGSFLETFVRLQEIGQQQSLEAAFPDLVEAIWDRETRENTNFRLLPFNDYYDTFLGNKSSARILLIIGIATLLIAAINFMNLSTAQASQRSKEIGVRKVLGALRGQLSTQFFVESILLALVACGLAVILTILIIPYFNAFFDVSISIGLFSYLQIAGFLLTLLISLGVVSGSYPALYLSSMNTIDAIQKKTKFKGALGLRNGMVIMQFVIALFLITSALIIRNQISFMTTRSMGFEGEEIFVIESSLSSFADREEGLNKMTAFKNELRNKSYISAISSSRHVPTAWSGSHVFVRPQGWEGDPLRMRYTFMDEHFFPTYDIPFKVGRNFNPTEGEAERGVVILNEAAAKAFEFNLDEENAIMIGNQRIPVVGVVEDFNFESLQNEVAPTLMFNRRSSHPAHARISIKMEMSELPTKIEELEGLWSTLGATSPFTGSFMNNRVEDLYQEERRYLGLVTMFSTLAIVIACIGIYGLTLFLIERRRKEISIRKVLGAESKRILQLIVQDFARWVVVGFVISIPVVVYMMQDWLNSFHYRIDFSAITFIMAFGIVLLLVTLTVGYESLKASLTNPVKHLKDE